MRQIGRRQLLGGLGIGTLGATLPTALLANDAPAFAAIRTLVTRYVRQRKVAGMVAAIGLGQGGLRTISAGRLAIGVPEKVDRDTLWRIYSMTKPVTGMAAMLLIEDGVLGLDQPIHEILPQFREMTVLKRPAGPLGDVEPARTAITIRHLLTHTAGLGYNIVSKGPIRDAYIASGINPGLVTRLAIPSIVRSEPARSFKAFADNLAKLPLVYQPGTKWSYSVGLDLLGYIIELAAGMPFESFLKKRLFDPLGMTSSFFTVPKARAADLAFNYAVLRNLLVPIDPGIGSVFTDKPSFPFGGAGLVSSARDYDRFLHMLMNYGALNGSRVMAEATARLAMSNLLPAGVDKSAMLVKGDFGAGGLVGYGGAGSAFGWAGAAGTIGFVDPVQKLRAACYAQYMPYSAYPLNEQFIQAIQMDIEDSGWRFTA